MENLRKFILPIVAGGLLSISSCGKQPESAFVETIPSKLTVEKTKPKQEVKIGLLSVDDPSIPQAVKDRFNKMVRLSSDKAACHTNPAKIDSKSVYLTSAHCNKIIHEQIKRINNRTDAPVYSAALSNLSNEINAKFKLFQFPKVLDGTLIYMGLPTSDGNPNYRKVFVGHSKTINTENGTVITTQEPYEFSLIHGSSGSFVSDQNGKLLGTLKGFTSFNSDFSQGYKSLGKKPEPTKSS
jgi:hypothetical protein